MKKFILAAFVAAFSFSGVSAQSVKSGLNDSIKQDANGNFYQVKPAKKVRKPDTLAVLTGKTFTNAKGVKYPVWRSAKGKYFVNICPASGKWYKKYLN